MFLVEVGAVGFEIALGYVVIEMTEVVGGNAAVIVV